MGGGRRWVGLLAGDGDEGGGAPGEEAIEGAPEPDGFVEEAELERADGIAAENAAIEVPAGEGDAVEAEDMLDGEAGGGDGVVELCAGIAAVMAEGVVDFAVGPLALGDEDDGAAAGDEGLMDVAERGLFGLDVFEDVEADDGVDGFAEIREVGGIGEIALAEGDVGAVLEARGKTGEVFGVEVSGDVAFAAGDQLTGEVADACSDFEDGMADVGGGWYRPSSG